MKRRDKMPHLRGMVKKSCSWKKIPLFSLLCCLLCCSVSLAADKDIQAGSQVTARYILEENTIILEFDIADPGPENIIVSQRLPKGTVIANAVPAFSTYQHKKGRAKWLLKNLKPGKHKIIIKLERPVDTAKIKASISFMNPNTGKLSKIKIRP